MASLDTSILVDVLRRRSRFHLRALEKLDALAARGETLATTRFTGDENGNVSQLHVTKVGPPPKFEPIPGGEFTMDTDLVLLAMGFTGPVRGGMIERLGVELDARNNVKTGEDYMSSVPGVFAAGDMRRGQSLVVWAIAEGRKAAAAVDHYLAAQAEPLPQLHHARA